MAGACDGGQQIRSGNMWAFAPQHVGERGRRRGARAKNKVKSKGMYVTPTTAASETGDITCGGGGGMYKSSSTGVEQRIAASEALWDSVTATSIREHEARISEIIARPRKEILPWLLWLSRATGS